jgi:branched-chain amino acid transport system ATP-binding protein
MSSPQVILLDEPSLGWPRCWSRRSSHRAAPEPQEKLTVLLVEQNADLALAIADHGYVMENGRIVLEGAPTRSARTPTSRSSISASPRWARGSRTETSSTTSAASAG